MTTKFRTNIHHSTRYLAQIGILGCLACSFTTTNALAETIEVNTGPLAAGFTIEVRQRTKGGTVVNQTLTAANIAAALNTETYGGSGNTSTGIKISTKDKDGNALPAGWIRIIDAGKASLLPLGEPEAVSIAPPTPAPAAPPAAPPPPPPGGTVTPSSGSGLGAGGGAEISPGVNERSFFRMVFDDLPTDIATASGLISLGYNDGFVASYAVNVGDSLDEILDALEGSLLAHGTDLMRTLTGIELFDPTGIDHAGIASYSAIGLHGNFVVGTIDLASPGTLALFACALPLIGIAHGKRRHREIRHMAGTKGTLTSS